jgi:5-guanidino-2-oxopentanoate decarboxylase
VTTTAGKGLLPQAHRNNLGTSLHHASVQALVSGADAVLAVGTELGETDFYYALKLTLRGRLIRIDIDPNKLADHYAAEIPVWGDAPGALRAIRLGLPARATARAGSLTPAGSATAMRREIERGFDAKAVAQLNALAAIRAALPRDGVVFTDMTQIAYFGNYAYPVDGPRQWFHPSGYGTLGFALPAAIGAMVAAGIPPTDVIARNPDFMALARACGAAAVRASGVGALTAAVGDALKHPAPTLIEALAEDF